MANDVLDTGEILKDDNADKTLKQELGNLAKDINVKESSSDKVDALFAKLDNVNPEAKNRALQYALKDTKIMVGNTEKSITDIAEVFGRVTEQDGSTWKIKLKNGASEDDKQLVEGFLNEKGSSLAYLIQLSSQKASLQASRGYGRSNADGVIDVGVDKVFGNQTRRALSGLKEWIQGDYTKDVESIDVKTLKVEDVLKMKFISKTLKEKIEKEAEDENVKNLWSNGSYELRSKYTNNYALKPISIDNEKWSEGKEYKVAEVGGKKAKLFTMTSLDELPDGYKRKDPDNYDANKSETYPEVFYLKVEGKVYYFYSNGRCKTPNGMKNTKDVVESLKGGDLKKENEGKENEEKKPEDLTKFNSKVFGILKKDFKDVLQELGLSEHRNVYGGGENPRLGVSLKTKEKYGLYPKTKGEWVNLHDFITEDGVLDKEKLKSTIKKMNDDYEKEVKLDNQEKIDEQNFLNEILKNGYTFSDLFGNEKENIYYSAFFDEFPGRKVKLTHSNTTFQGEILKIELNKGWPNIQSWLRGHSIEKKELKGQDGKYDVKLFKQKLKDIVTKIVKENFEK